MPDQTPEPLTDDELRADMANGWAPHAAQLAAELLAARARITELEAEATNHIEANHNLDRERTILRGKFAELEGAHDAARDIARSNSHALNVAKDDLRTARELIDWFTDDEPCDFDHHGGCQAHNHYEPDTGAECPNAIALRWLAAHQEVEA